MNAQLAKRLLIDIQVVIQMMESAKLLVMHERYEEDYASDMQLVNNLSQDSSDRVEASFSAIMGYLGHPRNAPIPPDIERRVRKMMDATTDPNYGDVHDLIAEILKYQIPF